MTPIAARLSRKLHEVFGTEAGEAMVDWMQRIDPGVLGSVDALDRKVDALDRRVEALDRRVEALDRKVEALDRKVETLDRKVDALEHAFDRKVDATAAALTANMDARIGEVRLEMTSGFARLETMIERHKVDLTRWAVRFWIASLIGLAGALAALSRLTR